MHRGGGLIALRCLGTTCRAVSRPGGLSPSSFKLLCESFSPYAKWFAFGIDKIEENRLSIKVPFKDEFVGNRSIPAMHGGVVASLIDHVGGFCAWSTLDNPMDRPVTTSMNIDYHTFAPSVDIVGEAQIVHKSRNLITTEVKVFTDDGGSRELLASGTAKFYHHRPGDGGPNIEKQKVLFKAAMEEIRIRESKN